ncbi:MAG: phosphoribosylformylglycinamidine synthase subunit PurL [Elusimicrobia bacterium]|nr:phosphoribosylformylglycinamidine synthase subunit PurL [Elusimicrobiota bacterium]
MGPIAVTGERVRQIPLLAAADAQLERISREGLLSLTLEEMRVIQRYFQERQRDPTDVELETLAQTWSEHCKHKTFRGTIEFVGPRGSGTPSPRVYRDLLKETVMRVTEELAVPWCLSVFQDNAGVIAFDEEWALAFKVETHNHPSALEPYGGAGTGVGGVIRDVLGVGLGAKPVLNTDVFCFGPVDLPGTKLPAGVLAPRRIMQGVVAGVRDYGNRMGIPTANGAILFDEGYVANPLVFCGTVGFLPRDKVCKSVQPGDLIVLIGGRTGRDGIHGATFSSTALTAGISSSVVQIGHAIMEKKILDVLLQARDQGLYRAVTDCGAGGLSSAVGELGATCGVRADVAQVPLKYSGLAPWEIWLSESQERMVLAVPLATWPTLQALCASEGVEATAIGEFTNDRALRVMSDSEKVAELDMEFLHHGMPRVTRQAIWRDREQVVGIQPLTPRGAVKGGQRLSPPGKILKQLLAHPNIASKEWVIRQYDHEVQGGSVIKPLVGAHADGPSDSCVFRPRLDSWSGVVVANGINPWYGMIDPYWMAACCIDEALRNLVAVGGDVSSAALLDNFCWGNPEHPEELGGLVRAAQACYDVAKGFRTPFISGKDSLHNTWRDAQGQERAIPGTLLISAIGLIPDARQAVTMDYKVPGDLLYLLGETREELGGSHYHKVLGRTGGRVPRPEVVTARRSMVALHLAIQRGLVRACHDLSEGGLGVAAAEMAFAGEVGANLDLAKLPFRGLDRMDLALLFSESPSRWLVEVSPHHQKAFEQVISGLPFGLIGKTITAKTLVVHGINGRVILRESLAILKRIWLSFSRSFAGSRHGTILESDRAPKVKGKK